MPVELTDGEVCAQRAAAPLNIYSPLDQMDSGDVGLANGSRGKDIRILRLQTFRCDVDERRASYMLRER